MKIPKIPLAQTVIQLCKAKGIKHIVISPGSRNAPLTIGFTNDPFFQCYSIVDERSAAFFALGIAQQIKYPVALVCTSGSALLNYFPAVAEAYYSDIPLVVLSADRPKYLIGIGDGQTIDQQDVYGKHVMYSANLKLDIDEAGQKHLIDKEEPQVFKNIENNLEKLVKKQKSIQEDNEGEINQALSRAINSSGPVHINCPFDEPLYETIEQYNIKPNVVQSNEVPDKLKDVDMKGLISTWNSVKRKMILIGVNYPNSIKQEYLDGLAKDESVVVFTETTSNLYHDDFFPSIDKIIAPLEDEEFKKLQPDLLVTIGGMIVSKKIKAFLREYQPKHHWHIDDKKANDTFFCLDKHILQSPNEIISNILSEAEKVKSDYQAYWKDVKNYRVKRHEDYLRKISFSDFSVFNAVLKSIPEKSILHLGNSSTIRYTQLFDINKTLKVFCNRGTSGIDGSTSTAIGGASVSQGQNVLVTGDLGFFYDSNALWNNYIPNDFRIIVINNSGGGIFRILPGHKDSENFDQYFETTHDLDAKALCNMYGFGYQSASSQEELVSRLSDLYSESNQPKLLEIFTPRTVNDRILISYFEFIK